MREPHFATPRLLVVRTPPHAVAPLFLVVVLLLTAAALAPAALAVEPWSTGDGSWLWQNPAWDANTIRDQTFLPDGLTGYQVGDGGLILKTTDGGGTWRQLRSNTLATLTSVSFDGPDGCAVGTNGTVVVTADAGLTWLNAPSGTDSHLLGLTFAPDGQTGWAVGYRYDDVAREYLSIILKTADGGSSWGVQKQDISGILHAVASLGSTYVVAAGGTETSAETDSLVLSTTNGGTTWAPEIVNSDAMLQAVSFVGDVGIVAVGGSHTSTPSSAYRGVVLTSTLNGTWNEATQTAPTAEWLFGVTVQNLGNMFVWGANSVVLRSTNGGATWTAPTVNADGPAAKRFYCADFTSAANATAVGEGGAQAVTTDGGATWNVVAPYGLTPRSFSAVQMRTAKDAWVVGASDARFPNSVLHTLNGGATWDQVGVGGLAGGSLQAVDFVSAQEGWILGDDGVALHTTTGGASWSPQTVDGGATSDAWYGLDMADADHGVAVGWGSGGFLTVPMISYTIDGSTWQPAGTPGAGGGEQLHAVGMADALRGVAVGSNATVIHTSDGGDTWTRFTNLPQAIKDAPADLWGLSVVDAKHWWVSGSGGMVVRTADGGATWQEQPLPLPPGTEEWVTYVYQIRFADLKNGWATVRGAVYHTTNGGTTWTAQRTGTGRSLLGMVWADRCHGLIVGEGGAVLMTSTGGWPDKTGPNTYAWGTSAKLRATAKLRYRADDLQSMTATVTVKVKNARGKVVKTLACGKRQTGKQYTAYLRLGSVFKRGTYKYLVYARDESKRAQIRLGWGKLVVK